MKIPFFANLPDGTHCYQAALKMILTYFSKREWSYKELDQITQKLEGKWTWPTASLIWLLDNGYEIQLVEEFSFKDFAKDGKAYLEKKCGKEVALAQEQNSDLAREQALALELSKRVHVQYQIPQYKDLERLMKDGFLILCNVNASKLYQKTGYSGHFVVPIALSPDEITLHDPGLPPFPSLKVSKETFERAWGYPTEHEKNLLAIRKLNLDPL